jgi:hypothetical protein
MSKLRPTLEALATQFASSILEALRRASIDELMELAGAGARRPRLAAGAAQGKAGPASSGRRSGGGGRLGRRSADDIAEVVESIVRLLGKHEGGLRAEQIREALGVQAKELPRPLAEALASGRVAKSGQKRATTYTLSEGGAAGSATKRRRPAARRKKG